MESESESKSAHAGNWFFGSMGRSQDPESAPTPAPAPDIQGRLEWLFGKMGRGPKADAPAASADANADAGELFDDQY